MVRKKKVDLCTECSSSTTPGIQAARLGHEKCLILAYRELGVFNERDNFGATPIHYAARYGHITCLKWLVDNSGISTNAMSQGGMTAAHDAAAMGHLECLIYLLQSTKCTASDQTEEGATVLHIACRFGRLPVVKWLLREGGCSPSQRGGNKVTPIHLCAARDQLECLQYLTQHPNYIPNELTAHDATPVYFAAQDGSLESLKWLVLNAKGDPLLPASDGMAPIHAAAQAGQLECLRWLVDFAGVSPRMKSGDGATPTHFAAAGGRVECLEWLMSHGATPHDKDKLGGTPLHDAAEQGELDALKVLIRHGGDVTLADSSGLRPIDLAKDSQQTECLKALFKSNSDVMKSAFPESSKSRGNQEAALNQRIILSQESSNTGQYQEHQLNQKQSLEVQQREFEINLLAGVSEEKREEIWQEATKEGVHIPVPGLKQLLEQEDTTSERATWKSNLMGSRPSTTKSYKALFGDPGLSLRQRPALSPDLFSTPPTSDLHLAKQPARKQDLGPSSNLISNAIKKEREVFGDSYEDLPDLVDLNMDPSTSPLAYERPSYIDRSHEETKESKGHRLIKWLKRAKSPAKDAPDTSKEAPNASKETPDTSKGEIPAKSKKTTPTKAKKKTPTKSKDKSVQNSPVVIEEDVKGHNVAKKKGFFGWKGKSKPIVQSPVSAPGPYGPASTTPIVQSPVSAPDPYGPASTTPTAKPPQERASLTPVLDIPLDQGDIQVVEVKRPRISKIVTEESDGLATDGPASEELAVSTQADIKPKLESETEIPPELAGQHLVAKNRERTNENEVQQIENEVQQTENEVQQTENEVQQTENEVQQRENEVQQTENEVQQTENEVQQTENEVQQIKEGEMKMPEATQSAVESDDSPCPISTPVQRRQQVKPLRPRQPSSEKIVIREGMGKRNSTTITPRTPDKGVSVEFVKTGRLYNKRLSQFRDSDLSSPEVSDTEEPTVPKKKPIRFDDFGVEIKPQSPTARQQEIKAKRLSRQLAEEFQTKLAKRSLEIPEEDDPTPTEVKRTSLISPKVVQGDSRVKLEVDIGDDVRSSSVVNINLDQLSASQGNTPAKTGAKSKLSVTNTEDVGTPSNSEGMKRSNSSVLRLAAQFESVSPPDTPTHLKPTPTKHLTLPMSPPRGQPNESVEKQYLANELETISGIADKQNDDPKQEVVEKEMPQQEEEVTQIQITQQPMPLQDAHKQPVKQDSRTAEKMEKAVIKESKEAEDSDVLTPLKRISASSPRRPSSSEDQVRSDGISPLMFTSTERGKAPLERPNSPSTATMLGSFVHSADSRYLQKVKAQYEEDEIKLAEKTAQELTYCPQPTDDLERRLQAHVISGTIEPIIFKVQEFSVDEVAMTQYFPLEDDDYICVLVECAYPPQPQLFIWTKQLVPSSGMCWAVKKMMKVLPGRPLLHIEVKGHESPFFQINFDKLFPSNYKADLYAPKIDSSILQLYRYSTGAFHEETLNYFSVTEGNIFLLYTPTKIFVRVVPSVWDMDDVNVFSIAKDFILQHGLPEWISVTIATKYGEPQEFTSLFPTWPHANLHLVSMASELHLTGKAQDPIHYSSAGRLKIWKIEGREKILIPLDQFGFFHSSHCYLLQFSTKGKQHEVFLWVGSDVTHKVFLSDNTVCQDHLKGLDGGVLNMVIPEGREVERFLNIFKGKFIIQNTPKEEGSKHLYRVSGSSALRVSAREVPALSSSLHSSHSFIAYTGEELYIWSGQFSPQHERRGALILARMLDPDFLEPTALIPEGQETEEFWDTIGGKGPHPYMDPSKVADYVPGKLYIYKDKQFSDKLNFTKQDLREDTAAVLWKGSMIFIWCGRKASHVAPLKVAMEFNKKICPNKSLIRDFVMSVETEGQESQEFWRLFSISEQALYQVHIKKDVVTKDDVQTVSKENITADDNDVGLDDLDGRPLSLSYLNLLQEAEAIDVTKNPKLLKKNTMKNSVIIPVSNQHGERIAVQVSRDATVVSVLLRLAHMLHVEPSEDLTLIEFLSNLKLERIVEDHETFGSIVAAWTRKQEVGFIVREVYGKYKLWTRPSLPKSDIRNFMQQSRIPSLYSSFAYKKLSSSKWIQDTLTLEADGVYSVIMKGKGSSRGGIISPIASTQLYMPDSTHTKGLKGITRYCFVLKPVNSNKPKDSVIFSAGDETTLNNWIEAIRLIKFGSQLKSNHHAMLEALHRYEEERVFEHSLVQESQTPEPNSNRILSHYKIQTTDL